MSVRPPSCSADSAAAQGFSALQEQRSPRGCCVDWKAFCTLWHYETACRALPDDPTLARPPARAQAGAEAGGRLDTKKVPQQLRLGGQTLWLDGCRHGNGTCCQVAAAQPALQSAVAGSGMIMVACPKISARHPESQCNACQSNHARKNHQQNGGECSLTPAANARASPLGKTCLHRTSVYGADAGCTWSA